MTGGPSTAETADALFARGELSAAIAAALLQVKSAPRETRPRAFLVELLCFDGSFERARAQLDTLARLDPGSGPGALHIARLIAGEQQRRAVLAGQAPVAWLVPPPAHGAAHAEALAALDRGGGVGGLLAEAEAARPPLAGICDGDAFDDCRDLDDRLAPVCELITEAGEYRWISWDRIDHLLFRQTQLARDLIWRSARLLTRDGVRHACFIPALYPAGPGEADAVKLGRETRWRHGAAGLALGAGRKLLLLGETDRDLLAIEKVAFT